MAHLPAPPRAERLAIPALLALALATRLWALGWGLPYVEHPDEPFYTEIITDIVREGDASPRSFWHPPLLFYMLAPLTWLHGALEVRAGRLASLADLPQKTYFFTVDPGLYLWNRAGVAVLGALTVLCAFALGRRMFGPREALLGAGALAVAGFHVEHSHYVATSAPAGLWATLALLGAWEAARTGRWRGYLLAGLATGLASATKYNAGVVSLVLGLAAAWAVLDRRRAGEAWARAALTHSARLAAAAALAVLVFFLANPFALVEWPRFLSDLGTQSAAYTEGSGDFLGPWNLGGYLGFLWRSGLGPAGAVLLLAGLPLLLRRAPRQAALLLGAVAIELLLLLPYPTNFVRNLLIVYPALLVLAAAAAVALADRLGAWAGRRLGAEGPQLIDIRPDAPPTELERRRAAVAARWSALAIVPLAGLLVAVPLAESAWLLRYWSRPHTMALAAETLRAQPRGMLAAVELNPVQWAGDPAAEPVRWLGAHPPDWYRDRGYRFLVVNRENYDTEDQAAYRRLLGGGKLLLELPERDLGLMPGPGGALIDLGEHAEHIPFVRREAGYGGQIALLGYEMRPGEPRARITPLGGADERVLAPGEPLQINLYWRALAAPAADYTLFLHLYDAAGQRVAQRDLPPRHDDYPPSRWRPGELVIDRADMPLPALPPGEYRLEIGLYDAATGAPLAAEGGAPVTLTTVTIQ